VIYFSPSHSLNRQSVTIDALSNRTTTLFDAAGNATQVTDANNHNTQFLYDAVNRKSVAIDALGNRTTTLFDAVGKLARGRIGQIDAQGLQTRYLHGDVVNQIFAREVPGRLVFPKNAAPNGKNVARRQSTQVE
jgi:YD repeat-containing protein